MKSNLVLPKMNLTTLSVFLIGLSVGAISVHLIGGRNAGVEFTPSASIDRGYSQVGNSSGRRAGSRSGLREDYAKKSIGAAIGRKVDQHQAGEQSGEFAPRAAPLASAFELSPDFRAKYSLTDEVTIRIQNLLRKSHRDLTEYAVLNVRRDETLDVDGEGYEGYRIPADPELGERLRAELAREIETIAGRDVSDVLTDLVGGQMDFLKFAQCDIVIKLHESERSEGYQVSYQFRSPVSGEFSGGGRMGMAGFNNQFGQIFSVVDE